jgi:hypothetical protein
VKTGPLFYYIITKVLKFSISIKKEVFMLIYMGTVVPTGKSYVGYDTHNEFRRRKAHLRVAKKMKTDNKLNLLFPNAINKYGADNVRWQILEDGIDDYNLLKERETFNIIKYDTFMPNGYNMTLGGDGKLGCTYVMSDEHKFKIGQSNKGRIISDEQKSRISQKLKGRPLSQETKDKMSASRMGHIGYTKGTTHEVSQETREKIRKAALGRKMSDEARKKMSESHKNLSKESRMNISLAQMGEKNHNYGVPFTQEHCDKISQALKGRSLSEEHIKNIKIARSYTSPESRKKSSESHKGKPSPRKGVKLTPEQKQKIRDALKAKPMTDEHKWKMAEGRRLRLLNLKKKPNQDNNNQGGSNV